jgi:predicted N-acetyltransferase YhbS/putative sterol carrier protein
MNEESDFLCRVFQEKDEEKVKQLIQTVFKNFLNGEFWDWKYKQNPNFDPSLVAVAEKSGKIIGCNHWLPEKLKTSDSTYVQAVLGGDLAVSPEYRGCGVGKKLLLFLRSSNAIGDKRVALFYMFADPNLAKHLYEPAACYVPAPTTTTQYFKLLNWSRMKNRVKIVNEKTRKDKTRSEKLPNSDLRVLFKLSDAPGLLLEIDQNGIRASEEELENPNIILTSDLATLYAFRERKGRLWKLTKALLKRRLKIKGGLFSFLRFYQSFWLIEDVFDERIY